MIRHARLAHALILGSFFFSGVAGLLYQVVWTRYLALFLGHTSYAVVAVLAAFMGGLALGNAWLGSVADRVRRPLMFYAGLELGIGVFALLFPAYYDLVHGWFIALVRAMDPGGVLRLSIQFGFAGLTILLPTVLMGATLPALTRFVTRSLSQLRGRVAVLYAINSSGAVLGTVCADWWSIPRLGLESTLYLGASLSIGVGLIAVAISRVTGEGLEGPVTETPGGSGAGPDEQFSPAELRLALVGIGASGFVAMVYEIAWTRLLALALGSTTHAYSLMLATFISGIAAGGWIVSRWRRQAHTLVAFGLAELALAATLFISIWFYDLLPWWFVRLSELLARRPGAYPLYELFQALICFGVMFVPAVCLGTTLPLASRVATVALAVTGRSVGRVFAVNTAGTVLGAVVGGLILMPHLGLAHTFALGIALNALIGTAILVQRYPGQRAAWFAPLVVLGMSWFAASALEPRWQKAFVLGIWRDSVAPGSVADYREYVNRVDLRYHRDGAGSTVAVIGNPLAGGREQLSLRVNGKTDATSVGDMSTQVLMGHLPLLLKPTSSDALVVGLGSGVTVGAVLRHPGIAHVDVVEISPEVVTVARDLFGPFNNNALADARVRLSVEDAKSFLAVTPRQYDVIVTEPSNPWMAGVAAVFSHEYYASARDRLKPGGLVAQWLQVYETNDRIVDTVVNTFSSVFPNVGIWQVGAGDLVLIGSMMPRVTDLEALTRRFDDPLVRADLARVGIQSLPPLLMQELIPHGDAAYLPETSPETPIHSDFRPVLEYEAQRAFFERVGASKVFEVSEPRQTRPRMLLSQVRPPGSLTAADFAAAADLFRASSIPDPPVFRSQVRRWLELGTRDLEPLRLLVALDGQVPVTDAVNAAVGIQPEFALALAQTNIALMREQAGALMVRHRTRRSAYFLPPTEELEAVLKALVDEDSSQRRVHRARLAEVLWDRGDEAQFLALALKVFSTQSADEGPYEFDLDPRAPRLVIARMLQLFVQRGDFRTAIQLVKEAVQKGFAGEKATFREPLLEYQARRVLGTAMGTQGLSK